MTSNPTDLAAVLRRSAEHIQQWGHHKDDFCAPDIDQHGRPRFASTPHEFRPTCMAGAIRIACGGSPSERSDASDVVIRFASEHMDGEPPVDEETGEPEYVEHLAAWNDDPERTASDVVARLWCLSLEAEMATQFITGELVAA